MSVKKELERALKSRRMDPKPWLDIHAATDCMNGYSANPKGARLGVAINFSMAIHHQTMRAEILTNIRKDLVEPARSGPKLARYRTAIAAIDALIAELTPEPTP